MSSRVLDAVVPDLSSGVFTDTASPDTAVSVRGLSKSYSIARNAAVHTSAGEAIMHRLRHPFEAVFETVPRETFWALSDVSFDIQKGDVVGIIGRNGAGKSTLLKILSRITAPTQGRIDLYGRVGSLLEVGTGFHPELTGRENIYLNGAILGMQKREIARQFDAIVEFSGTEQFLDTPVKRYSSGMYVRLAFAVAAHLNPEILIVDEVLAVGDAEFQKKCMGKMQDVADSGRTVLFVSHNIQALTLLCRSAILLSNGSVSYAGHVANAVEMYLGGSAKYEQQDRVPDQRPGSGEYRVALFNPIKPMFSSKEDKSFAFRIEHRRSKVGKMFISVYIYDSKGVIITQCDSRLVGYWLTDAQVLEGTLTIDTPWFKPGEYRVDVVLSSGSIVDDFQQACRFDISPVLPYEHATSSDGTEHGLVFSSFNLKTFNLTTQKTCSHE